MAQVRRVLEFILRSQLPYPTMIIDRAWNVVLANAAFEIFVDTFSASPSAFPLRNLNLMRLALHPQGLRPHIVNIEEFEPYMVGRVRRSLARLGENQELAALFAELADYGDPATRTDILDAPSEPRFMMPLHLRKGALEIRLFTTIATLGAPQDITLQELFIETGFPVDDATEIFFRSLKL